MEKMTARQREILTFIAEYSNDRGYAPTYREIGERFDIALRGVQDHLNALRKKGFLRFQDRQSRTLEVLRLDDGEGEDEGGTGVIKIPLLGVIAAGEPVLAEENRDGGVPVPASALKRGRRYFALRVRGDSMTGAGIMDGDLAVLEAGETAEDRDIVAARVGEAVTLKRFFREDGRIRLQPENAAYAPIYAGDAAAPSFLQILGRLSQVIRQY